MARFCNSCGTELSSAILTSTHSDSDADEQTSTVEGITHSEQLTENTPNKESIRPIAKTEDNQTTAHEPVIQNQTSTERNVSPRRSDQVDAVILTPSPTRPFAKNAREWATSRQADILLYLGALLLVAAVTMFVSSQGTDLPPSFRVGLLLAYTIGFIVAGLFAQRSERIREAGAVFLAIGALITPLNILVIYSELLATRDISQELVWLIGSLYGSVFYGILWQRGYGRLYVVPGMISLLSSWAALAEVLEIPADWYGTWWISFLAVISVVTHRIGRYNRFIASTIAAFIALTFLVQITDSNLFEGIGGEIALPVSLTIITGWLAFTGWSLRSPMMLPYAATSAIALGIATIRALGLEADWAAYSPLTIGILSVYTRRWWAHWDQAISQYGWLYSVLCSVTPLAFITTYDSGINGAVSFLMGAVALASVTWRNRFNGFLTSFNRFEQVHPPEQSDHAKITPLIERTIFAWIGLTLLLFAIAYSQREIGIVKPNTGWSYIAISLALISILGWTGRTWDRSLQVLIPPALAAMIVGSSTTISSETINYPGNVSFYLGIPMAAFLGSFSLNRRWPITLVASVIGAFTAAAIWFTFGWATWTLAVTYSAAGCVLFTILTSLRTYQFRSTPMIATILSWSFIILGPIVAFGSLLAIDDFSMIEEIDSPQYRSALFLLLLGATLLLYEGWRFRNWTTTSAATAVASVVVGMVWTSYTWPIWMLAISFLAIGVIRFATMTGVRTYRNETKQLPIVALSWGLVAASPIISWLALIDRMSNEGGIAVDMVEYRSFVVGIFAFVPLLLYEAQRLRARLATVSASVLAMSTLLLTIAIFELNHVQAYTIPVGLYLIAFGLFVRRSVAIVSHQLMLHEVVLLAGITTILLPQIQEALQPDGANWGVVILLEGLFFLFTSFLLGSRWLTVSGVLAISAVAIRWLAINSGATIPYWLLLSLVGMSLLALGTIMLLARDRWNDIQNRVVHWWRVSATLRGVGVEVPAVTAPIAVALIAIFVAIIEDWTA